MNIPSNIDAEQYVLGILLTDFERSFDKCVELSVDPKHFYLTKHQVIYEAIVKVNARGEDVEPIAVKSYIDRNQLESSIGGQSYLLELLDVAPYGFIQSSLEIIIDCWKRREIIDQCKKAIRSASESNSPSDVIVSVTDQLDKISGAESSDRSVSDFVSSAIDMDKKIISGERVGLSFPWSMFDHRTMGIPKKAVTPIAGRDKGGKSWLSACLAEHWLKQGIAGLYLPFEDSGERLVKRMAGIVGGYDNFTLRRRPTEEFVENHFNCLKSVEEFPLVIEDVKRSPKDIVNMIAKSKRKHGIEFVFIDGFKDIERGGQENATQQDNSIMSTLVYAATKYDVSIIPIMHLTKIEDNVWISKRNIKGSGTLFQSARMVLLYQDQGIDPVVQSIKGFTPEEGCIVLDCPSPSYGETDMVVLRPEFHRGRFVEVTNQYEPRERADING